MKINKVTQPIEGRVVYGHIYATFGAKDKYQAAEKFLELLGECKNTYSLYFGDFKFEIYWKRPATKEELAQSKAELIAEREKASSDFKAYIRKEANLLGLIK